MFLQTEHSCITKTWVQTQKHSEARRSSLSTSVHQTQLTSISSIFDTAGSTQSLSYHVKGSLFSPPGYVVIPWGCGELSARSTRCILRARVHPASTAGTWSLHSWRFSTLAGNFHGAEACATDGDRGWQCPGWLGASPSHRVAPGLFQLPF